MPQLSPHAQQTITDLASRYQVSPDAVLTLLRALQEGGGQQAQFSHPELGGMGQWSHGGMIMIGDMFNADLKARVSGLCSELVRLVGTIQVHPVALPMSRHRSQQGPGVGRFGMSEGVTWWPAEFGTPSSSGAQNDMRYAVFPATRRLAVNEKGRISIYDTGDHRISGVSQQQGPDQSLTFTSQHGPVRLADLPLLSGNSEERRPESLSPEPLSSEPVGSPPEAAPASVGVDLLPDRQDDSRKPEDDIFATIERLAELHRKDIITDDEFTAKKTELLSRL